MTRICPGCGYEVLPIDKAVKPYHDPHRWWHLACVMRRNQTASPSEPGS